MGDEDRTPFDALGKLTPQGGERFAFADDASSRLLREWIEFQERILAEFFVTHERVEQAAEGGWIITHEIHGMHRSALVNPDGVAVLRWWIEWPDLRDFGAPDGDIRFRCEPVENESA